MLELFSVVGRSFPIIVHLLKIGLSIDQEFTHFEVPFGSRIKNTVLAIAIDMVDIGSVADKKLSTVFMVTGSCPK